MDIKTVFMGSPEFALPILRQLAERYPVVGVVTQPDRPAGRGKKLTPPPLKELALELSLPVIQPSRMSEPEAMQQLQAWAPDLIVVAAFGQILRPAVLDLPAYGCINVHGSLLPRWRGAAPIHAAILNGDPQTGVTIMIMDPGVDTGPVLSQAAVPILPADTTLTLSERMSRVGAGLLIETLPGYLRGEIQPVDQSVYSDEEPTYAPTLKKEDGLLDFTRPAEELERRVRAFNPWPGAFFEWGGGRLKVLKARPVPEVDAPSGSKLVIEGLPAVAASPGVLILEEVQPAGKKSMPGEVFLRGARDWK
jgi:methionyl-tRNA formyltransferase